MSVPVAEYSTYINSVTILLVFVGCPWVPFLIGVRNIGQTTERRTGIGDPRNYALLLSKYSYLLSVANIIWAVIICASQATYIINKIHYENQPSYYMQVDLPEFNAVRKIEATQAKNSYLSISSTSSIGNSPDPLYLVYRSNSWSNVLTAENLHAICISERDILKNIGCIDKSAYRSFIPQVFNTTDCRYWTSYEDSIVFLGQAENSDYIADDADPLRPFSNILQSYFGVGTCKSEQENFASLLNKYADGDITVVYSGDAMGQVEFQRHIDDAIRLCWISAAVSAFIMALYTLGVAWAISTYFCIVVALINATAVLPVWGFGSFSVYNVVALFILIGIGANSTMLYAAAIRSRLTCTTATSSKIDVLMSIYGDIGYSMFFTICITLVGVFSMTSSPVIVLKQLGSFLGVSVAVFYVCFHYIMIPVSIAVHDFSQYCFKKSYFLGYRNFYQKYFEPPVVSKNVVANCL
jgi:hypothetical protein